MIFILQEIETTIIIEIECRSWAKMFVKYVVIGVKELACRGVEELELIADVVPSKADASNGCRMESEAICVSVSGAANITNTE